MPWRFVTPEGDVREYIRATELDHPWHCLTDDQRRMVRALRSGKRYNRRIPPLPDEVKAALEVLRPRMELIDLSVGSSPTSLIGAFSEEEDVSVSFAFKGIELYDDWEEYSYSEDDYAIAIYLARNGWFVVSYYKLPALKTVYLFPAPQGLIRKFGHRFGGDVRNLFRKAGEMEYGIYEAIQDAEP